MQRDVRSDDAGHQPAESPPRPQAPAVARRGWDNMVVQLYPKVHKKANWPPKVSFTNGGPLGVAFLMDRWRGGEKVSKITKDGFVE